jgi:hypothetical protein
MGNQVSKSDLEDYAEKTYVDSKVSSLDLTEYAKKSELPAVPDLAGYALKSELPVVPDLTGYALKSDLEGYAKMDIIKYGAANTAGKTVDIDGNTLCLGNLCISRANGYVYLNEKSKLAENPAIGHSDNTLAFKIDV